MGGEERVTERDDVRGVQCRCTHTVYVSVHRLTAVLAYPRYMYV